MDDMPEDERLLDEEGCAGGKFDALSPDPADAAATVAGGGRRTDWPRRWRFGSREHLLPLRVRMSLFNFL